MWSFTLILVIVAVITFIADMYLLIVHCEAGVEGSSDVWDSELCKKMHYKLAPISLVAIVISAFMLTFFCS